MRKPSSKPNKTASNNFRPKKPPVGAKQAMNSWPRKIRGFSGHRLSKPEGAEGAERDALQDKSRGNFGERAWNRTLEEDMERDRRIKEKVQRAGDGNADSNSFQDYRAETNKVYKRQVA